MYFAFQENGSVSFSKFCINYFMDFFFHEKEKASAGTNPSPKVKIEEFHVDFWKIAQIFTVNVTGGEEPMNIQP